MSGINLRSRRTRFFTICFLLLGFCSFHFRTLLLQVPEQNLPVATEEPPAQNKSADGLFDFDTRPYVQTVTSWRAPIVWEGTFDPNIHDQMHIQRNTTVAVTVFAVGRYLEAYLKAFLTTAEQHFLLGLPVTYFVFTDLPEDVPFISLAPRRYMKVIQVMKQERWQDISMMRMKTISNLIESEIVHVFDYVFCFDVDQQFKARFGSEILGDSVALIHAHFYKLPKDRFTYDKNPKSKAFLESGDYYYHAAIFGGTCQNVKNLVDACYQTIMEDKANGEEALWHDESHLNKYFFVNKPSRLLSPEYCWDPEIPDYSDIKVTRLVWMPKEYKRFRENL